MITFNILPFLPVTFIIITGLLSAIVIKSAKQSFAWQKKKRSPFTSNFLRAPGQSLGEQIEELRFDLLGIVMQLMLIPVFALFIPLYFYFINDKNLSLPTAIVVGLIFSVGFIYFLIKLYFTMKKLQQMQLGYEGEIAVGQELNQLLRYGYQVFHDIPGDGFNIDHVVVGKTGVFAVETKARSKPITKNRSKDAHMEFDGKTLKFPTWSETKPIQQAQNQSLWLNKWLSSAIGEVVVVAPVLAIPGWFIKRSAKSNTYIYNGKSPEKLFPKVRYTDLSEQMIQRISHQLDAKCRDIEPKVNVRPKTIKNPG